MGGRIGSSGWVAGVVGMEQLMVAGVGRSMLIWTCGREIGWLGAMVRSLSK